MPPIPGNCALDDSCLRSRLADIISTFELKAVVETGVNCGWSTYLFSTISPMVFGVDNDEACIEQARRYMEEKGASNWRLVHQNSPDAIRSLVQAGDIDARATLFFLDAHWQAYWPLKDEIAAIPRDAGVIAIHDALVPGQPSFGYDTWDGTPICYDYLREALSEWSPGHLLRYNTEAEFPNRGVMFVFPATYQERKGDIVT